MCYTTKLKVHDCSFDRTPLSNRGPGSNGTANRLKLISLEIYGDAIEVQAIRQGGRKLNFDSPNQLFVPESAGLDVSSAAKWAVGENEHFSEPPPWTLSRFTVPLLPRGRERQCPV
jgi:hypothetical protein